MKTKNLFGEWVEISPKREKKSPLQQLKDSIRYRESETITRTCKNCANHYVKHYHDHRYHKCEIIGHSFGAGTDIRLKMVCDKWECEN